MKNRYRKPKAKVFTIPNVLSCVRICLIPVIVWLYRVKLEPIWASCVLILSGLTDIADGYIARHFHMTSDLGKVLDPIADKLTQAVMLLCLLCQFPWVIVPIVLMVGKEIFMSVTGFLVLQRTDVVLGAEWHGKVATCLLYGMILLHMCWYDIPSVISTLSILACTLMIVISFVLYGIRNINILQRNKPLL